MSRRPLTRVGFQYAGYSFPGVMDNQLFQQVVDIAHAAEASGFDSLWTMDHVHQIASVGEADEPILEAYTTLAALAAVTTSARLGVLVSCNSFRNPALLAKMVTTIDVISQGRAVLGIGAGWHTEETHAYGMEFRTPRERLAALDEAVRICRAMFTEHAPRFSGKHHSVDEPLNVPAPISPGGGPAPLRRGGGLGGVPRGGRGAGPRRIMGGAPPPRPQK
ncbi:LLM class flavin-dependent oxidoreductase, partial [Streptomyces wedmorensis]